MAISDSHPLGDLVVRGARREHVVERHDQRRVRHEAQPAVDRIGEPGEHPCAVARSGLGHLSCRLLDLLPAHPLLTDLRLHPCHQVGDADVLVPCLERAHARRAERRLSVPLHARHHDFAPVRRREPQVSAADLEAGGQALHVPLPRPGQRLIEVVDVEKEVPLGRREHAEVGQVCVAAELHREPAPRRVARSEAMSNAPPRKNANGDSSMRP